MANHCVVTTKKNLSEDIIHNLLNDLKIVLNDQYSTKLNIEFKDNDWVIECQSLFNDEVYVRRCFWLNSKRNFELRHGGGGNFAWWVDYWITNEIALRYKGIIRDDSGFDEKNPVATLSYIDFIKNQISHRMKYSKSSLSEMKISWAVELRNFIPPDVEFDIFGKSVVEFKEKVNIKDFISKLNESDFDSMFDLKFTKRNNIEYISMQYKQKINIAGEVMEIVNEIPFLFTNNALYFSHAFSDLFQKWIAMKLLNHVDNANIETTLNYKDVVSWEEYSKTSKDEIVADFKI